VSATADSRASSVPAPLADREPPHTLRWVLPVGLLVPEYLLLSLLVDLPSYGPASRLAAAIRLAVPVVIAGAAAAWVVMRSGAPRPRQTRSALPPWRPWPALALQVPAFVACAALARARLAAGAPPATGWSLLTLAASAAPAVLLAVATAAPIGWTLRLVARRWRVPILAIALGLLSWRALTSAEDLWGLLSGGTLRVVAALLRLVSADVVVDTPEKIIGVRDFVVQVAPVCSGVDGVGLILVFLCAWMSVQRAHLRWPHALVLLPFGVAVALAANLLRIAVLLLVGGAGHEDLAMGGFHSKLGWILFIAIALAIVAGAERLPWLRRAGRAEGARRSDGLPDATVAHVAPFMAALAAALVAGLWSDGSADRWYAARAAAALLALLLVRRSLPSLAPSRSWAPAMLGAAVCLVWLAAAGGDARPMPELLQRMSPAGRWSWITARAVGSCIALPLVEELAFRGFLLPWLVSVDFEAVSPRAWTFTAVVVSSAAFGAVHHHWLLGALAGLAFAAAYRSRGRLGDAVLAHALCNAGLAAAVLFAGHWDLWD
jgi:exosortase E/protease (VPEID-CTERM system)